METLDEIKSTKRPDFLTVLCVLTFISVAYHAFSGIMTVASAGTVEETVEAIEDAQYQMEDAFEEADEMPSFVEGLLGGAMDSAVVAAENAMALGIGELIIFLIIGFGAFKMWQQQKQGFYIYAAANVAWIFYNPIILGFNLMSMIGAGMVFFFAALFIGLYAATLTHMS